MNALTTAQLIVQYGLPFAQQIVSWIETGKQVTAADLQLLQDLAKKKSSDYLTEIGVVPPTK